MVQATMPGSFKLAGDKYLNSINTPTCSNSNGSNWNCLGPFFSTAHQGIVVSMAFDPDDATHNTLYIGTKFSGIWKTTNAQSSSPIWQNLQSSLGLPEVGVPSIVVLLGSPKRIYIATGSAQSYGKGLYK